MARAERSGFETALLSHVGLIRHIGRARLDDGSALDDFTQEVLASACAYRARHGDPDTPRSWLAAVARNMATDWNRKQRPTPVAPLPEATAAATSADEAEDSERWATLLDAVDALDPTDRDIVYRRYFQDESYDAIGQRHGLSREAIGFRLHRSRRRLRRRLEGALAAFGFIWASRARGLYIGVAIMKLGHGAMIGGALVIAILALVAGIALTGPHRDMAEDTEADARAEGVGRPQHPRNPSYGAAPEATKGAPDSDGHGSAYGANREAPASARTGADASSPFGGSSPEPTPREAAQEALAGFAEALSNYDPRVDADALVSLSAGHARDFFLRMRQEFVNDAPAGGIERELEQLRRLRIVEHSFTDGELRAIVREHAGGADTALTMRPVDGVWKVVEVNQGQR